MWRCLTNNLDSTTVNMASDSGLLQGISNVHLKYIKCLLTFVAVLKLLICLEGGLWAEALYLTQLYPDLVYTRSCVLAEGMFLCSAYVFDQAAPHFCFLELYRIVTNSIMFSGLIAVLCAYYCMLYAFRTCWCELSPSMVLSCLLAVLEK